jgi:hypothetical protein
MYHAQEYQGWDVNSLVGFYLEIVCRLKGVTEITRREFLYAFFSLSSTEVWGLASLSELILFQGTEKGFV